MRDPERRDDRRRRQQQVVALVKRTHAVGEKIPLPLGFDEVLEGDVLHLLKRLARLVSQVGETILRETGPEPGRESVPIGDQMVLKI